MRRGDEGVHNKEGGEGGREGERKRGRERGRERGRAGTSRLPLLFSSKKIKRA